MPVFMLNRDRKVDNLVPTSLVLYVRGYGTPCMVSALGRRMWAHMPHVRVCRDTVWPARETWRIGGPCS